MGHLSMPEGYGLSVISLPSIPGLLYFKTVWALFLPARQGGGNQSRHNHFFSVLSLLPGVLTSSARAGDPQDTLGMTLMLLL